MTDAHTAESASFSYSEFTPVKARKNRKNRYAQASPSISAVLATLREQIRQQEWFAQCSQIIESSWNDFSTKSPALLCLGLGSPSSSGIARVQLAFLTETCNRLNVAQDAVSVYDPVFTAEDKVLFEELQMRVLSKNNSADYALAAPTICFMPHCDIELYEAVLRSNWSLEGLSKLFILGNQLQEYIDNKPTSALESTVPCLLRAAPRLESQPLPISSTWPTAFNNTSAQYHRRSPSRLPDDIFMALPWQECGAGQADKSENPIEKERQGVGNSDLAAAI